MLISTTPQKHFSYSKDPVLFMREKWLAISAISWQFKYIIPFDYQTDFIESVHKSTFTIAVKTRQMHISSMMALYIAWYALFNKNKNVVIISNSLEGGIRIVEAIRVILQGYSVTDIFHWEDDFIINNKTEITLKNGCKIKAYAPSPKATKGYDIDFMYVDEAAYVTHFDNIHTSLSMCLTNLKDSKYVVASTPKDNSTFNEMFLNSNNSDSCSVINLHWSLHPFYSKGIKNNIDKNSPFLYSSPWFDDLVKNRYMGNVNAVEQELECIVRYKKKSNKSKTISLRLDTDLYKQIQCKLQEDESVSDYIRNLISKDIKSQ
jgi:hypothetical protein